MMKDQFDDIDLELKDLSPEVKAKALEILAEMTQEDRTDQKAALKKAIEEAENWFMDSEG